MTKQLVEEYVQAARSIAPMGIMMASFMLVYSIWLVFAWQIWGWIFFGLACALAVYIMVISLQNILRSQKYPNIKTSEGRRIGKAMGILSGISYGILWFAAIILALFGEYRLILPVVTFIIALHFFPQAKIFDRTIDYFVAPIPLTSSIIGFYLAFQSNVDWTIVYAVTGIGGTLATGIYGIYFLIVYRQIVKSIHDIN